MARCAIVNLKDEMMNSSVASNRKSNICKHTQLRFTSSNKNNISTKSTLQTHSWLVTSQDIWTTFRTLFSYENLGSTAREFSRKCETLRCENFTLAIICPLLLINGIDVTILWAGLAKRSISKEISCSRNLVAARNFNDVR